MYPLFPTGHVSAESDSAEDIADDQDVAVDEEEDDEEEVLMEEDQIQHTVRMNSFEWKIFFDVKHKSISNQ